MKRIAVADLDFVRMEPRGKAIIDKFWVCQNGVNRLVKLSGFKIDQDIMEMLSSLILSKIGIDCVDVDLGYDKLSRKKCCLVTSYLKFEGDHSYDMFEWTTLTGDDALEKSINQVFFKYQNLYGIDENNLENLKKSYIRILLGKCIIENFDSKLENIGLIFNEKDLSYRLPPSFDNGFAFKSYNSFVEPVCFVGNQFFEIQEIIEYIIINYFDYVADIIPRLESFVENDLLKTVSLFERDIIPEKQQYIISYIQKVNNQIQSLINEKNINHGTR